MSARAQYATRELASLAAVEADGITYRPDMGGGCRPYIVPVGERAAVIVTGTTATLEVLDRVAGGRPMATVPVALTGALVAAATLATI